MKKETKVHIRWTIRRDMPEILEIENLSFPESWSEEDFVNCLRQRNCIGMAGEINDRVVAFMIYELQKTQIQILNFAVHPDYRKSGIGSQLVEKLIGKLSSERRTRLILEVRDRNLTAQVFFRSLGFRATRVIRDCYEDTNDDAYRMEYRYRGFPTSFQTVNRITGFVSK